MRARITGFLFLFIPIFAYSAQITDNEIKNMLIQQSVSSYLSSVGNCPCPYNRDRIGRLCGRRSAWSRPGGYAPLCYSSDVTEEMLQSYRGSVSSATPTITDR